MREIITALIIFGIIGNAHIITVVLSTSPVARTMAPFIRMGSSRMACDPEFWNMTVGDLATWFGGIASAAAAWAAWSAARAAMRIAQLPIEESRRDRAATARIFATSIAGELLDVAAAAHEFIASAQTIYATGIGNGRAYLRTVRFNPMLATARAIPFINCFEPKHAALVMGVIAAKGALDDRIGKLGSIESDYWNLKQELDVAIGDAGHRALELAEAAEAATQAMKLYETGV